MPSHGVVGWAAGLASEPGSYTVGPTSAPVATPAWYDVTWNPTAGCSPVGRGCDHCEALRTVAELARMSGKGGARYGGLTTMERAGPQWTGAVHARGDLLAWPLLQRWGRRILVNSLSDLFHESLTIETIDTVHAVMTIAHWHRFMMLTRRADRMRAYYADPQAPQRIAAQIEHLARTVLPELASPSRARGTSVRLEQAATAGAYRNWAAGLARVVTREPGPGGETGAGWLDPWPLPNLALGVAVEDQDHAGRIAELLQTPASMRWACFEPLLGPVRPDLVPIDDDSYVDALGGGRIDLRLRERQLGIAVSVLPTLDWVIAGGETGAGARPTDLAWVRDLRDRCTEAGIPFFFKQWGEWAPAPDGSVVQTAVRRGRRAAGRLVDGRSWDEMFPAMAQRTRKPR